MQGNQQASAFWGSITIIQNTTIAANGVENQKTTNIWKKGKN